MLDAVLPTIHDEFPSGVSLFCHRDYLDFLGSSFPESSEPIEEDWLEKPVCPCKILLRTGSDEEGYSYVAEISETKTIVFDLPPDAFYFADKVYERPHHQYWSFRHEMMIPDDMFPEAWRNRETDADQEEEEL